LEEHAYAPGPMSTMDSERRILSFKDYKGFKKTKDINSTYKMF